MISARALGSQPYAIDTKVKLIRFEEIQVWWNVTYNNLVYYATQSTAFKHSCMYVPVTRWIEYSSKIGVMRKVLFVNFNLSRVISSLSDNSQLTPAARVLSLSGSRYSPKILVVAINQGLTVANVADSEHYWVLQVQSLSLSHAITCQFWLPRPKFHFTAWTIHIQMLPLLSLLPWRSQWSWLLILEVFWYQQPVAYVFYR